MAKNITYDYHTPDMIVVTIPVTKKHNIKLYIKEDWNSDTTGIYPPSLSICIGDKPVTDAYIKGRTPNLEIAPTGANLKTAMELIEEAEYRMAERRNDANESTSDED